MAPGLALGRVQRSWACLRTMTDDREPAVGEDPRLKGLYWLVGLGGRGMSCGVAAGELLARSVVGLSHPLARPLAVSRLLR
ncbi:MAG: FAD-dependent oxidoreductase [Pseudoxanthomonas sp.]